MKLVGNRVDGMADEANVNVMSIVGVIETINGVALPSVDTGINTVNSCIFSSLLFKCSL